jgi:hypothetical protein
METPYIRLKKTVARGNGYVADQLRRRIWARGWLRMLRFDRVFLLREASNAVGSVVNGVERHSIRSACDNPTAKRDRSSISSRDLIADRNSMDAIRAMPWSATFETHFVIITVSVGWDAPR